jgi:hypothetical protein
LKKSKIQNKKSKIAMRAMTFIIGQADYQSKTSMMYPDFCGFHLAQNV